MRILSGRHTLGVITTLIIFASCTSENDDLISATGTLRYVSLEGGFYGIVADDSAHYEPINLAEEFQVDGLRVRFEAKPRDDLGSFRMWGRIIELVRIERL